MRRRRPCSCRSKGFTPAQTGGLAPQIVGPDSTRAYMQRVDGEYRNFDADVMAQVPPLPASFITAWAQTLNSWRKFYADNIDSFTLGWSRAEYDETEKYELTLSAYRKQFTQHTGKAPASPDPPKAPDEDPFGGGGSTLGDLATVVKWGVIGYLAIQLVGVMRNDRR
jgi:hypothetical protein